MLAFSSSIFSTIRRKSVPVLPEVPSHLPKKAANSFGNEGSGWTIWTSFGIGGAAIATTQDKILASTTLVTTCNVFISVPLSFENPLRLIRLYT